MSSLIEQADGTCRIEFGDGLPLGHELVETLESQELSEVERARQRLAWLKDTRATFRELDRSPDADDAAKRDRMNGDFLEESLWLPTGEQAVPFTPLIVFKLARMTLAQLGDFCEWNVARTTQRQTNLDAVRPVIDETVLSGVERLHAVGFIDRRTVGMYEQTVASVGQLVIMDHFDAGGGLANGTCTEDAFITLADAALSGELWELGKSRLCWIAFHEYTHATGALHGTGFAFGGVKHHLLEEMFAGHVADAALNNASDPNVFDPTIYPTIGSAYEAERVLGAALMQHGPTPVSVDLICEGFYAKGKVRTTALRSLIPALDQAVQKLIPQYAGWQELESSWDAATYTQRPPLIERALSTLYHNAGYRSVAEHEEMQPGLYKSILQLVAAEPSQA